MKSPGTYFRLRDPGLGGVEPVYEVTPKDQIKPPARVESLLGVTVSLSGLQVTDSQLRGFPLHVLHKPLGVVVGTHLQILVLISYIAAVAKVMTSSKENARTRRVFI